ncbi:PREDICTED: homeobox-DDT domain protein RLT1-like isoform X2 [Lupinus angustifolius]|uniref:homeobox-DDT domain protein RLT1-like isoform X2 n=1 Tax=Lupinus angustifolius TaxID=3871 RepID=UPI00092F3C7F|nr:PREDICTED: homeobox-DDT domain protein RLT1-like isoform X2 [Lupinus angustifolius]
MEVEADNNTQKRDEEGDNSNENNNGSNSKIVNSNEGQSRPKRQMKTPFQLEMLEKAYAMETYPSEETRAVLSEKLGLSDRQLQMWFCHRRLKEKKDSQQKKLGKMVAAPTLLDSPIDDIKLGHEPGNEYGSVSGSGSSPFTSLELRNVVPRAVPGYYESPQTIMELRAIACVEAQLGEPLREDGPSLGIDFDPLPPDAFGAPIEQQKRPSLAYDNKVYERHDVRTNKAIVRTFPEYPLFLPNQSATRVDAFGQLGPPHLHDPMEGPTRTPPFPIGNEQIPRNQATQSHYSRISQPDKHGIPYSSPPLDNDVASRREFYTSIADAGTSSHFSDHPVVGQDNSYALPGGQVPHNDTVLQMENKKNDDTRVAREVDAYETRIRKELEKQDNMRRKNEERLRKELERQDRERKKEEERLMRERLREEERSKREQKREIERREKFMQKENLKAEKRRQKEELRREKEAERRKAALEKAAARRIAKESMELIEDEQLELMELAAASKGLSSIINLDLDTLQNLESFRDSLCVFPPKSVKLRKPFAINPWINSEQNVGNLLMVWRFLITFADVLELWPFTLDEFLQAFHDYDSRLLGEIHVALLKVIIKDVEDVARTPSTGLGVNQNGAANPGGGHPEIVEGAYSWGFDIRNWQKNLNQLTWPEIFRQLALSAGFGPQLKKRNISWSYANDKNEGRSGEDIISTLRNGSAAQTAVAKMHEKGLLGPRRSRHRLTPGTVKFAAFHVLSLEGNKGLTVLDLAEKIQKSGLRDLTTSKTPEASISVALTRDTKLFERIAPSTYRVRSAFRKDPADAESILSEARKKIQIFENGFLAGEDVDDVEREDSESDEVDEDPEIDDLVNPSSVIQNSELYGDTNICTSDVKESLAHDVGLIKNEFDSDLHCFPENGSKDSDCPTSVSKQPLACADLNTQNLDQDDIEIDESKSGESWVQGLTEGEYSDLSVEERLNALVALVGVANEGNSIRVVLEDRLEAANALKKQMWAEAQIDKIRLKDDIFSKSDFPSLIGNQVEIQYTYPAIEGNQSPLLDIIVSNVKNEASPSTAQNQKVTPIAHRLPVERSSSVQDLCSGTGPDNPQTQVPAPYSKRSRSQLKSYIAHMAEEMYIYRSLPLGQDRRRNRYWLFVASVSSNDPGSGRIFVECHDDGKWMLIDSEEAFDVLLTSLDSRGIRESHLRLMLKKIESSFKENVRKNTQCAKIECPSSTLHSLNSDTSEISPSFKIDLGKSESEKKAALRRYQDFQKWMWKECHNSSILCAMKSGIKRCKPQVDICDTCFNPYFIEDSHCNSCHRTFPANNGFNYSEHAFECEDKLSKDICISESSLPLRTRLLKFLLACIEVSVLHEAFGTIWTDDIRKRWGMKLSKSSSIEELLQILSLFERALQRDFLSSNFSTTDELLGLSSMSVSTALASTDPEFVAVLPWVPQTTAALSLRLFEIDSSISYVKPVKPEPPEEKEAREYIKLPSRYTPFKFKQEVEPAGLDHNEFIQDKSAPKKVVRSGNKRGRGSKDQGRGKKLSKRPYNSKQNIGRRDVKVTENLSLKLKQQQGQGTQGQAGGRGRRTVRKRRVEKRAVEDLLLGSTAAGHSNKISRVPMRSMDVGWEVNKASPVTHIHMDVADNSNSTEEVESDDNAPAVEYDRGNWEIGFSGVAPHNRWSNDLVGMSDEDVDASEDDNDNSLEEQEEEDSEADVMSEGSDGIANRVVVNEDSDSAVSEDSSD